MWNKRTNVVLLRESSRYINDSFGPAICSLLSSRDSGGDLAEVAGPAGPLLRTIGWTGFLSEIRIDGGSPPLLFNDNQACVTEPTSGNFKSDNRYFTGVRYYSIYKSIALGTLMVGHIAGDEMLSDGLTKPLGGTTNCVFVSRLGMV